MRPHIIDRLRGACALAGWLVTAACSTDGITAPAVQANHPDLAVSSAAINTAVEQTVRVGKRLGTLQNATTARATIGAEGGRVRLPELGFELVVPPGAVSSATQFSVTALPGATLSYEFEPHGATFSVPLLFRQDGRFTAVGWGQRVGGAYFTHASKVDLTTKKAQVAEQIPGSWNGFWIEFRIKHFSGYLVSCA